MVCWLVGCLGGGGQGYDSMLLDGIGPVVILISGTGLKLLFQIHFTSRK
jgi:hypothetical protein